MHKIILSLLMIVVLTSCKKNLETKHLSGEWLYEDENFDAFGVDTLSLRIKFFDDMTFSNDNGLAGTYEIINENNIGLDYSTGSADYEVWKVTKLTSKKLWVIMEPTSPYAMEVHFDRVD